MAGHVTTSPMPAPRALFRRLPRLVDMVPWVELADGLPTPVEQIEDGLFVQRDDATDSHYGGNKVRKLEFVLPIALRKGGPVMTAGAIGSHHVYATAVHAQRLGLEVEAVRYPQPETDHVRAVDAALRALPNVRHTMVPHRYAMPPALIARRVAIERAGGYAVLPGATSPLGVLGHVSAALELIDAFANAGWPAPDDVVVALGSGGSAAGLTIGLQLGGWKDTTVVAVRVADAIVTNRGILAAHAVGTFAVLGMAGWRPRHGNIAIDRGYLGNGYGHPTDVGEAATAEGDQMGVALEPTYTAKAFASALDRWRAGRRVVFVQTYAGSADCRRAAASSPDVGTSAQ
jgi:D-cysteine desulfhydrase